MYIITFVFLYKNTNSINLSLINLIFHILRTPLERIAPFGECLSLTSNTSHIGL